VRSGGRPLVPASAGTAALEVAGRVLESLSCIRLGASGPRVSIPLPVPASLPTAPRRKSA